MLFNYPPEILFLMSMAHNGKYCFDINNITTIKVSDTEACAECIKTGSNWVHLRTCQTCGVNLCCDNSPNRHATRHYISSKHTTVASSEKGERWIWCYEHRLIKEY